MQSQRTQPVSWNFQVKLHLKKLDLEYFEEGNSPAVLGGYHFVFLSPAFNSLYCILSAAGVSNLLITKFGVIGGRFSGCIRDWFDLNFIFNFGSSLNSTFRLFSFFASVGGTNLSLQKPPQEAWLQKKTGNYSDLGGSFINQNQCLLTFRQ